MANELTFKLEEKNTVKYGKGAFSSHQAGIWLTLSCDYMTSDVVYLCSSIDELNIDDLIQQLQPKKLLPMLRSNLSGYEMESLDSLLCYPKVYYLDLGNTKIEINTISPEERDEYVQKFENELKASVEKYGEDNVEIIIDWDDYECYVLYTDGDKSYICSEYYAVDFISRDIVSELADKYNCSYLG